MPSLQSIGSAVAIAFGVLAVGFIALKVKQKRQHLRRMVGIVGHAELHLIESLEQMVRSGELSAARV
jgi:hypothetical protein